MWSWDNKNHQQYSQSLVVKSGTINLFPGQGTAPGFRRLKTVIELRFENMLAQFYKPIYTQPWGQISGSMADHQREWALLMVLIAV